LRSRCVGGAPIGIVGGDFVVEPLGRVGEQASPGPVAMSAARSGRYPIERPDRRSSACAFQVLHPTAQ